MVKQYLIADVSGAGLTYLRTFFTINGVHQLNNSNSQFHDLLKLFLALEKFWSILQDSLELLKNYLVDYPSKPESEIRPDE